MTLVRYFAAAREASGVDEEMRSEATLGALRLALSADHPALAPILPRCAVLVTGERTDDTRALTADDVIDVLPPFAGG
ncbi:MoaD/ThiS family protein [Microbacterium rhizomatis]|uniref:MoaD/ThiS family protein n=1 Tax=Microbacterium rhizomatis TaxID=1631477 RepID=A0A5J5J2K2_9MICO|nr:MoaD/ThiS family protein [Microbacterium rhizomatis]KAA9107643.1 MoaD/ThiS family protein [Microbacterium rhizomatis]